MTDSRRVTHPFAAPDRVTIVSGLPRAGTSLLMQILEAAGLALARDDARPPDADNPRGYFELAAVTRIRRDTTFLAGCRGRVVKVVAPLLLELPLRDDYRVVFIERELEEVLASQRAMLARQGHPIPSAGDLALARAFEATLARCRAWLARSPEIDAMHVQHHELIGASASSVARIADFLERTGEGARGPVDAARVDAARAAMAGVVDASLYRQRG